MASHRIVVLGDEISDKTNFIQSLISGVMQTSHTDTDAVRVDIWRPSTQHFSRTDLLDIITGSNGSNYGSFLVKVYI